MIRHQLNLHRLPLYLTRQANQLILRLQQLLMLLLIHRQILLSIILDGVLLILQHALLHRHELAHRISFEAIQQVLQPIAEVFGILIDYLRQDFPLLLGLVVGTLVS